MYTHSCRACADRSKCRLELLNNAKGKQIAEENVLQSFDTGAILDSEI